MRTFPLLVLAAAFAATACAAGDTASEPEPPALAPLTSPDTGTVRLHYIEHAIGEERYSVRPDRGEVVFEDDFRFLDRGGRIELTTTGRFADDLAPLSLTSRGTSYRFIHIDTGWEADREAPADFVVTGYAPLALQGLLVRRWEAAGRPDQLAVAPGDPGDPTRPVRVAFRGVDTVEAGGRRVPLHRYAIDGAVWGREAVWLEPDGRFAALLTSAPFLPFEGVREDLAGALPRLQRAALVDRMEDLARWRDELAPVAEGRYALVGARIVDGTGAAPLVDGTVVIEGDRIAAVGPSGSVAVPDGARAIDARGTTLIPGLWEMHAHVAQIEWAPAYLAAGATTVRDMGGEELFVTAFRDALAEGRATGPRLLLAGLVDGPGAGAFGAVTAASPEEGRAVVERYHAAGFDQMKLYTLLAPEVVEAVVERAHELGMSVTGHIPSALTLEEAVEAGLDHIAHLPLRGDPGDPDVAAAIALLAERGVVVDATLSWGELLGRGEGVAASEALPRYGDAPWPLRAAFNSVPPAGTRDEVAERTRARLALVGAMHRAGVPIVAGTDGGVPGQSLLREIELLGAAGLTPMEAIQAATVGSARAMGMEDDVGTLRPGMRADLLVLEADPLADLANLREGRWVVAGGRMFETARLWEQAGFGVEGAR